MPFTSEFTPLDLSDLRRQAALLKADGWRFIETHAAMGDEGVDLYYAFMKDGRAVNYRISGVTKDMPVPSITDLFLAAFVFENEARELFGVDMRDIAIDFNGAMYAPALGEPMTIITPEQKAAKERAAKAAAAKAAKESGSTAGGSPSDKATSSGRRVFVMTPELQARLDKKLATMSPEKVAKVEAALAARKAEAEAASSGGSPQGEKAPADAAGKPSGNETAPKNAKPEFQGQNDRDAALERGIALLDPQKAEKVRAAFGGMEKEGSNDASSDDPSAEMPADAQVEALIGMMDEKSAAIVRGALAREGRN